MTAGSLTVTTGDNLALVTAVTDLTLTQNGTGKHISIVENDSLNLRVFVTAVEVLMGDETVGKSHTGGGEPQCFGPRTVRMKMGGEDLRVPGSVDLR